MYRRKTRSTIYPACSQKLFLHSLQAEPHAQLYRTRFVGILTQTHKSVFSNSCQTLSVDNHCLRRGTFQFACHPQALDLYPNAAFPSSLSSAVLFDMFARAGAMRMLKLLCHTSINTSLLQAPKSQNAGYGYFLTRNPIYFDIPTTHIPNTTHRSAQGYS